MMSRFPDNRTLPNILVTGTPGTGKTTTAELLAQQTGYKHINVGDWVKQHELHSGWDAEFQCFIVNEDKVVDALEEHLVAGGNIVDYHGCDFFPERWFDLVVVLQTDNTVLYDRLEKRGYSQKKLSENIECEIMHVIHDEAHDAYRENIVIDLPSNTPEDMERNVGQILNWLRQQAH